MKTDKIDVVVPQRGHGIPIKAFLADIKELSYHERSLIVEQAIMLLEGFHVNLPLKYAMYAVDPLRRLRLLLRRLPTVFNTDRLFHREMTQTFSSINDLHTNYILPTPYLHATASLPFTVEYCLANSGPTYLATKVQTRLFSGSGFGEGVEIIDWNGVPISRVVEILGSQSPFGAGNPSARHARSVSCLAVRPLKVLPPPDDEYVVVGYRTHSGRKKRIEIPWLVSSDANPHKVPPRGLDGLRAIQTYLKSQLAPKASHVQGREVKTPSGTFGYLRIFTFENVGVDELIEAVKPLPENGLIIDLRGNLGGTIPTAEKFLQVVSPNYPRREIVPERFCLINTPLTLKLCKLRKRDLSLGPSGLRPWIESIERAMETGATYSASFPFTDPKECNVEDRLRYPGPVIVVTDGLTCSAAEIFAAGFQDHGGKVLGVDEVTGGAGANVRSHADFRKFFLNAASSPFKMLPRKANFSVPFRRCQRVGPQAGREIEDFGVKRDYAYRMTRNDLLNKNEGLIEYAARILTQK
jgi:Peptidase family S41